MQQKKLEEKNNSMQNNIKKKANFDEYLKNLTETKTTENKNHKNVYDNKNHVNNLHENKYHDNKNHNNKNTTKNYDVKNNNNSFDADTKMKNNKNVDIKHVQVFNNNNKKKTSTEKMTAKNRLFLQNYHPSKDKKLRIIPLGGLEEIGMNITVFEDDNDIIIVDCGLSFPTDDLLGIDLVIPDVTYLKQNIEKVRGLVLTHGHEDHIGAIPYILKEINMPIYGTKLTLALVEGKLKEHKITNYSLNNVAFGDIVKLGNTYVEFIKTNHSIVDSCALALYTPSGIVMHTGDFKVDYTPVFGDIIDLKHFAEIGKMGVLALLSDSTNAIKPGFTMSESVVGKTFDAIFNEHKDDRIIVATFASNVDRVRQVIDTASRYNRKVVIEGRSMINIINIATELGYINIKKGTLVEIDMLNNYPPEKTVIITTGSQGESMAALSRMALGTHKKISIKAGDVVILSSTPIPGNEKAVSRIINELSRRHTKVIFQDTHVSGHACAEEIKLIYTLISPQFAIPIHGEYRHRLEAAGLAEAVGVKKENCIIMDVGEVLEICNDKAQITDKVQSGGIYVDGLGVGDVGNIVLKDRQMLANSGILIIAMVLSHHDSHLVSGPDVISKGFIFMKESTELIDGIKAVVIKCLDELYEQRESDWKKIKTEICSNVSNYLWKNIKREPLIIPIIMSI